MNYTGTPLKDLIEMLVGEWSIRLNPDGNVIGGLAGLDYAYLTACVLLTITFIMVIGFGCYVVGVLVKEMFYTLKRWR